MFTRSQKHPFVKQCEKCSQFNCCTHLPIQDTKHYYYGYLHKVVEHTNKLLTDLDNVKDKQYKVIVAHDIFSYVLKNFLFLIKNKQILTVYINKLEEFQSIKEDLHMMGKNNVEYYLYWLKYLDKHSKICKKCLYVNKSLTENALCKDIYK